MKPIIPPTPEQALAQWFPQMTAFRDLQREVILRLQQGHSTLYLAPTGGGKSLTYQVAGILRGGLTVVISPLRALIGQQGSNLRNLGLPTTILHCGIPSKKQCEILRDEVLNDPRPRFLFISPERAFADGFLEFILQQLRDRIQLITIDEAHCISQWGHSFRPSYRGLPNFMDRIFGDSKRPPILCLTATLNPREEAEICEEFDLPPDAVVRSQSLKRNNLALSVEQHDDEDAKLLRLVELLRNPNRGKTLVYVHRKSGEFGTSAMAERFGGPMQGVDYFDADRTDEDKSSVLEDFLLGKLHTVFATSAFGMGIDIPNIRTVIHYLMPESAEQYYQEVGRAGRDGEPAQGVLLFSQTNLTVRKDLIIAQFPRAEDFTQVLQERLSLEPHPTSWNLYETFGDQERALNAFHHLVGLGCVSICHRGIGSLSCFKPGKSPLNVFGELQKLSRTGMLRVIAEKRNITLQELRNQLFSLYCCNLIKLQSAPDKCLFLQQGIPLSPELLEQALVYVESRRSRRLRSLEQFGNILNAGGDPTAEVLKSLGINE